jgi:hypothetical protein
MFKNSSIVVGSRGSHRADIAANRRPLAALLPESTELSFDGCEVAIDFSEIGVSRLGSAGNSRLDIFPCELRLRV